MNEFFQSNKLKYVAKLKLENVSDQLDLVGTLPILFVDVKCNVAMCVRCVCFRENFVNDKNFPDNNDGLPLALTRSKNKVTLHFVSK